jgi:hypothetical protein
MKISDKNILLTHEAARYFFKSNYTNIRFRKNEVFSKEYLCEWAFKNSKDFEDTMAILVKDNVFASVICSPNGVIQKVYVLNPSLLGKDIKWGNTLIFKKLK